MLAGLALGSWLGGRVADRASVPERPPDLTSLDRANARRLVVGLVAAAVYAPLLVIALSTPDALVALEPATRIVHLLLVVLAIGLVPATLLGAAGPLLARMALRSRTATGRVVGRLNAATTVGGLFGTAAAGFALIPTVGVRGTALIAAAALVVAALLAARDLGATFVAAALLLAMVPVAAAAPHVCSWESVYQCIRVDEETRPDGRPVLALYLDSQPHTHVDPTDPLHLVHDYTLPSAELAAYLRPVSAAQAGGPTLRMLLIGGGGYALPRYFAALYPGATIDVLELDPVVTAVARLRLGLELGESIAVHHGDARRTLEELPADRQYDLAVLDAFADVVVPYHLVTREFDARVAARLAPDGFYAALVHDRGLRAGRLLPSVARTMRDVFGQVDVLFAGPGVRWANPASRTWTVVGSTGGVDPARLAEVRRHTGDGPFPPVSEIMPADALDELLAGRGPGLLTDDHAPVEQLAAPLFE